MRALTVVLAVSAALAVPLVCTANPAPCLVGPTGIITVPNTELVKPQSVDLGGHFFDYEAEDHTWHARIWHVNVGLCDNVELTVTPWAGSNSDDLGFTTFGAKWALMAEPDDSMGLAVGVYELGMEWNEDGDEQTPIWYIVGSKSLTDLAADKRPVRVNVGLELADNAWGAFWLKEHVLDEEDEDSPNLFLGVDAEVCKHLTVLADTNEFEDFNFGARVNPCDDLTVDLLSLDAWCGREFVLGFAYNHAWK